MGLRFYDFVCDQGHVTESLSDPDNRVIECPQCGSFAHRVVSAPNFKLDGITGDFPGAYDRWERLRKEKLTQERQKSYRDPQEP